MEAARTLGEDTLQRCRRVVGLDHRMTVIAATALALALPLVGEAESARTLGEDTLQRACRLLASLSDHRSGSSRARPSPSFPASVI